MLAATRILIVYEDGSQGESLGDDARQVWEWLNSGQALACIHNAVYSGPQMKHTPAPGREFMVGDRVTILSAPEYAKYTVRAIGNTGEIIGYREQFKKWEVRLDSRPKQVWVFSREELQLQRFHISEPYNGVESSFAALPDTSNPSRQHELPEGQ